MAIPSGTEKGGDAPSKSEKNSADKSGNENGRRQSVEESRSCLREKQREVDALKERLGELQNHFEGLNAHIQRKRIRKEDTNLWLSKRARSVVQPANLTESTDSLHETEEPCASSGKAYSPCEVASIFSGSPSTTEAGAEKQKESKRETDFGRPLEGPETAASLQEKEREISELKERLGELQKNFDRLKSHFLGNRTYSQELDNSLLDFLSSKRSKPCLFPASLTDPSDSSQDDRLVSGGVNSNRAYRPCKAAGIFSGSPPKNKAAKPTLKVLPTPKSNVESFARKRSTEHTEEKPLKIIRLSPEEPQDGMTEGKTSIKTSSEKQSSDSGRENKTGKATSQQNAASNFNERGDDSLQSNQKEGSQLEDEQRNSKNAAAEEEGKQGTYSSSEDNAKVSEATETGPSDSASSSSINENSVRICTQSPDKLPLDRNGSAAPFQLSEVPASSNVKFCICDEVPLDFLCQSCPTFQLRPCEEVMVEQRPGETVRVRTVITNGENAIQMPRQRLQRNFILAKVVPIEGQGDRQLPFRFKPRCGFEKVESDGTLSLALEWEEANIGEENVLFDPSDILGRCQLMGGCCGETRSPALVKEWTRILPGGEHECKIYLRNGISSSGSLAASDQVWLDIIGGAESLFIKEKFQTLQKWIHGTFALVTFVNPKSSEMMVNLPPNRVVGTFFLVKKGASADSSRAETQLNNGIPDGGERVLCTTFSRKPAPPASNGEFIDLAVENSPSSIQEGDKSASENNADEQFEFCCCDLGAVVRCNSCKVYNLCAKTTENINVSSSGAGYYTVSVSIEDPDNTGTPHHCPPEDTIFKVLSRAHEGPLILSASDMRQVGSAEVRTGLGILGPDGAAEVLLAKGKIGIGEEAIITIAKGQPVAKCQLLR